MFLSPGSRSRIRPHGLLPTQQSNIYAIPGARLSATSSVPITESDVAAATSVFLVPLESNWTSLFDGRGWRSYQYVDQPTVALTTGTHGSSSQFDCFEFFADGKVRLGTPTTAWSSNTTRSSQADIELYQGIYVNNGSLPLFTGTATYTVPPRLARLRGGFRTTSVAGQFADTGTNRLLWDVYRPVPRPMSQVDTTNSWTYTSTTFREANGSTANQLNWFHGLSGRPANLRAMSIAASTAVGADVPAVGIGIDSTTANSAQVHQENAVSSTFNPILVYMAAEYMGYAGIGYHQGVWLELGGSGVTFYGDANAPITRQTGIVGLTYM